MSAKANHFKIFDDALDEGYFSHAYIECGFLDDQEPRFCKSWGNNEDIFDLASLTKGLATGPLIYKAYLDGHFSLDQQIGDLVRALPYPISSLTIKELLGHSSGLAPWKNFWIDRLGSQSTSTFKLDSSDHIKKVFLRSNIVLDTKIDRYSDLGFILLGLVLEEVFQDTLDNLFAGFQKGYLNLPEPKLVYSPATISDECISTSFCTIRNRMLRGEVHDENCASLGGVSGHAGLFSSGDNLGSFLRSFAQTPHGRSFIRANHKAVKNRIPLIGLRQGDDPSSNTFGDGQAIGHLGFTGTAFWIDYERYSYSIFLSNRIRSGRISPLIKTLRREANTFSQHIIDGHFS